MMRQAVKERKTLETAVSVSIGLDGSGKADIATGVGFFDHMLTLLAKHGFLDLQVSRYHNHTSFCNSGTVSLLMATPF